MIRALVILCLSAVPAFATVDGWPALYDVIGVAENDVLNIRAEPDPNSEIVGTFAHDATDIEVIQPNEDFTWGYVARLGEGMGWVSLDYIVPQLGQWDGQYPKFTTCFGTEPFWDLSQTGGMIEFRGLDLPEIVAPVERQSSSLSHRGRHSFVAGDMIGVLSNQLCNDGMSELEFGWELNLIILNGESNGEHLMGCCSIRPPAE